MRAFAGVEAEAVGPDGVAPLIVGRVPARPGAPLLGLYAHYDGQPVTPADWATPPFQPTLVAPDGTAEPLTAPAPAGAAGPDVSGPACAAWAPAAGAAKAAWPAAAAAPLSHLDGNRALELMAA